VPGAAQDDVTRLLGGLDRVLCSEATKTSLHADWMIQLSYENSSIDARRLVPGNYSIGARRLVPAA
jgi:hypothetical protein